MDEPLADRRCRPCRGGLAPLTPAEVERLRAEIPGWLVSADGRHIARRVALRTYAEAFALVSRVSMVAEAENHHPDISFGWGYAAFSLTTHAIGGLHENDFVMAAKIDRLLETAPAA